MPAATTAWDFDAVSLTGKPAPLKKWRGKVALIVNVASRCGLTPQYRGLQALYRQFDNDASRRLQARPELGPTVAGESRCLRAIIHTVIKEMVVRLAV